MKDPTRLLDASERANQADQASEIELRLLRAGASEQPPAAAMQRLAQQLGVRGGVAVSRPQLAAAKKLGLIKLGAVLVGVALVSGIWLSLRSNNRPTVTKPLTAPGTSGAGQNSLEQQIPRPESDATQQPAAVITSTPDAQSLALEIARIDAVRKLLAAGRGRPASAALQQYARDFPGGVLHQEADVLNIEAQQRVGDRRLARALALRFLAQNPDSPHSAHVRELLQALGPDAR